MFSRHPSPIGTLEAMTVFDRFINADVRRGLPRRLQFLTEAAVSTLLERNEQGAA